MQEFEKQLEVRPGLKSKPNRNPEGDFEDGEREDLGSEDRTEDGGLIPVDEVIKRA